MSSKSTKKDPRPDRALVPLAGVVRCVMYHNPENGATVLDVKLKGRCMTVTVEGYLPTVLDGDAIQASGYWDDVSQNFRACHLAVVTPEEVEAPAPASDEDAPTGPCKECGFTWVSASIRAYVTRVVGRCGTCGRAVTEIVASDDDDDGPPPWMVRLAAPDSCGEPVAVTVTETALRENGEPWYTLTNDKQTRLSRADADALPKGVKLGDKLMLTVSRAPKEQDEVFGFEWRVAYKVRDCVASDGVTWESASAHESIVNCAPTRANGGGDARWERLGKEQDDE